MARMTKAGFARIASDLGFKKTHKKKDGTVGYTQSQVQRVMKAFHKGTSKSKPRKAKTKTKKTKKTNPKKGGNRKMGKNTSQSIWKLARLVAGVGPFIEPAFHREWPTKTKIAVAGARLTGYRFDEGRWDLKALVEGYGPLTATVAAQKASSFVRGLIRRL